MQAAAKGVLFRIRRTTLLRPQRFFDYASSPVLLFLQEAPRRSLVLFHTLGKRAPVTDVAPGAVGATGPSLFASGRIAGALDLIAAALTLIFTNVPVDETH